VLTKVMPDLAPCQEAVLVVYGGKPLDHASTLEAAGLRPSSIVCLARDPGYVAPARFAGLDGEMQLGAPQPPGASFQELGEAVRSMIRSAVVTRTETSGTQASPAASASSAVSRATKQALARAFASLVAQGGSVVLTNPVGAAALLQTAVAVMRKVSGPAGAVLLPRAGIDLRSNASLEAAASADDAALRRRRTLRALNAAIVRLAFHDPEMTSDEGPMRRRAFGERPGMEQERDDAQLVKAVFAAAGLVSSAGIPDDVLSDSLGFLDELSDSIEAAGADAAAVVEHEARHAVPCLVFSALSTASSMPTVLRVHQEEGDGDVGSITTATDARVATSSVVVTACIPTVGPDGVAVPGASVALLLTANSVANPARDGTSVVLVRARPIGGLPEDADEHSQVTLDTAAAVESVCAGFVAMADTIDDEAAAAGAAASASSWDERSPARCSPRLPRETRD